METKILLDSKAFPNSGFYILRTKNLYLIVNCNRYKIGHKHNDLLSFELYGYDKTFLLDSGTFIYTAYPEWRNKFRSTKYHNTVVVDGEEQNIFNSKNLFNMSNNAAIKVYNWSITENFNFLDAQHSGYERLNHPVTHRRQVLFDKRDGFWVIRDILTGVGKHDLDIYFHFAPLEIEIIGNRAVRTKCKGANLVCFPLGQDELNLNIEDGWVSYSYGTKVRAPIARYSKSVEVPSEFITMLYPFVGSQPELEEISLKGRNLLKEILH